MAEVIGEPSSGDTVGIYDSRGQFLCWGAYSPESNIRARIWSWDEGESIDGDFFRRKIEQAIRLRQRLADLNIENTIRLVHAESDRLPGLIVDKYENWLVVQFLACGVERWREEITAVLNAILPVGGIYERSDVEVRSLEGLPPRKGILLGDAPPDHVRIEEHGLGYWVDIRTGHKTGFYLDQRQNRAWLRKFSMGKDVLDCFCYTGGFTVSALAGGANQVVSIDVSPDALAMARENVLLNRLSLDRVDFIDGDVFQVLRQFRDSRKTFDLVVLDPPKFAAAASQINRAARGYKDINLLALKLLRPGGILLTFSCSGSIDLDLFQKIVAGAAVDAKAEVQIIERFFQAPDHPVALNFPEGAYLKGLAVYKYTGGH